MPKKYFPKLKFQVVKESLESNKSIPEIARAYDVHPNSVRNWMDTFQQNGPEVFGKREPSLITLIRSPPHTRQFSEKHDCRVGHKVLGRVLDMWDLSMKRKVYKSRQSGT